MKTLKTMMLGLVMTIALGAAKGNPVKPNEEKLTVNYAVNIYLNAVSHGEIKELNALLDDNLKYSVESGKRKLVFDKKDAIAAFKQNENVEQDCVTKVSINDQTPDVTIVKVALTYNNVTRTDFVTMTNSAQGWKITNIYATYK